MGTPGSEVRSAPIPFNQNLAGVLAGESFGAGHRPTTDTKIEIKPLDGVTALPAGPLIRHSESVPLSAGLRGDKDLSLEADKRMVQLLIRMGAIENLWSGFVGNSVVPMHISRAVSKVFERSMEWASRVSQEFKRRGDESMFDNREDFYGRLEQLQVATAAFLDLYGSATQREKSKWILHRHLVQNTALDTTEPTIHKTISDFRRAYAIAGRLRPVQFERFGELMEAVTAHIVTNHPEHALALRIAIASRVLNGDMSFSAGFLDVVRDNPSTALAMALNHSPHGPHDSEERLRAMNTFNQRMLKIVEELRVKGAEQAAAA